VTDQANPFDTIPIGLQPIYSSPEVNQAVGLYAGPLQLKQDDLEVTGTGVVQLEWLPRPRFWFHLHPGDVAEKRVGLSPRWVSIAKAVLRLVATSQEVEVQVTRIRVVSRDAKEGPSISGVLESVNLGSERGISSLVFHVVNFRDYHGSRVRDEPFTSTWDGRAIVEAGLWRVTLDKVRFASPVFEELKQVSGYAITHVGKLERVDGGEFNVEESDKIMEALFRYLSFCRGFWVGPMLSIGIDASNNRVFEQWRAVKLERWRHLDSWFSDFCTDGLVGGFPGFLKRWQDETWNEPLLLALHWYGEANMSAGGVEGSVILAQAAFEVLAWTLLVEDKQVLSEDGFQKIPAMDKLRLLIADCGMRLGIPASLPLLTDIAKAENWKDGPQALTEFRNALVHSNPKKRKKVLGAGTDLGHEAWELSLWYLELVLLRLFGYQGKYANRLVREGFRGNEVEAVPWA
jgi:hypothetical protein